jgi:hypothetical protein
MSHDTMAREATWKHRAAELDLAEQYYLAALQAITTPETQKLAGVQERSPPSPTSDDDLAVRGRRASDASQQSIASSATSIAEEDGQATLKTLHSSSFLKARALFEASPVRPSTPPKCLNRSTRSSPSKPSPAPRKRPAPIITPNPAQSYQEEQFSSNLSAFTSIIKTHLANVLVLKETVSAPSATTQFSYARSRSSTASSRPMSRSSTGDREEEGSKWARRTLSLRPRFDPESVRTLCNEALAEL